MARPKLPDPQYVIYALSIDGETHRYVGFTAARGLRQRMASHRHEARAGRRRQPYPWMREAGTDRVVATVLEKLPLGTSPEVLGEREVHWIAELRRRGYDLLNVTDGGPGSRGYKRSPDVQQRITDAHRGRTYSAEVRERMAASKRGRKLSAEHRAKLSEVQMGRPRGAYNWTPNGLAEQAKSGAKAAHNRWHVARGVLKEGCVHCTASAS